MQTELICMEVFKIFIEIMSTGLLRLRILEGIDGLVIEERIVAIAKEVVMDMEDVPLPIAMTIEITGITYVSKCDLDTDIETNILIY